MWHCTLHATAACGTSWLAQTSRACHETYNWNDSTLNQHIHIHFFALSRLTIFQINSIVRREIKLQEKKIKTHADAVFFRVMFLSTACQISCGGTKSKKGCSWPLVEVAEFTWNHLLFIFLKIRYWFLFRVSKFCESFGIWKCLEIFKLVSFWGKNSEVGKNRRLYGQWKTLYWKVKRMWEDFLINILF